MNRATLAVGVVDGDSALASATISAAPIENRIATRVALADFTIPHPCLRAFDFNALVERRGRIVGLRRHQVERRSALSLLAMAEAALVHHAAADDGDIDGEVHQIGRREREWIARQHDQVGKMFRLDDTGVEAGSARRWT